MSISSASVWRARDLIPFMRSNSSAWSVESLLRIFRRAVIIGNRIITGRAFIALMESMIAEQSSKNPAGIDESLKNETS
jgi:hypothetical protein